jgi:hypothetical protein
MKGEGLLTSGPAFSWSWHRSSKEKLPPSALANLAAIGGRVWIRLTELTSGTGGVVDGISRRLRGSVVEN